MLSRVTVAFLLMVSMQRGGGGGGGDMGGAPMATDPTPFEQFVGKLKIDEKKQLPDVQRMFSAAAEEAQPFANALMAARLRMLQAIDNAVELKAATDAYAAAEIRMLGVEIKAFQEVLAMLKPNQASKGVEAFALMAGLFNPPTSRTAWPSTRGGGIALDVAGRATGSVAAPAFQRGGGGGGRRGGGMGGGMSVPSRLSTFTLIFSLTENQKKIAKKTLDDAFKAAAELRTALAITREQIGVAIRDKQDGAISGATAAYAAAAANMATAEMKALAGVVSTAAATKPPDAMTVQTAASLMRGALSGKKWDTAPDLRFY